MYINKTLGHGSYIQKRLEREKPVCTSAVNYWLSRLQVLSISLVLSFPHFACIIFTVGEIDIRQGGCFPSGVASPLSTLGLWA